ncbi:uncharacterized protein LOC113500478 [Trichoplusia ni]|uniref:Odorant receptor n=1 Tax=Trichoplusia ni TaxID=7111 RepID=A0A7E5W8T3_TRINI|nr:uncharacterized protein LOC113500478 [Trichoplusia ni]
MLKKFKSFYNKENQDFSKGYVDPYEFHQTFYFVMKAFKVAELDSKHKPSLWSQNAVIFATGLLAAILSFASFIHGVDIFDIPLITEAGTYTIVLTYELLIQTCTRNDLPQYHNFLRAMKTDFHYICTVGEKYRVPYFEEQLKTWKICIFACIFTASIAIGMVIFAFLSLFYFLATTKPEDEGSRPLLFPFWLPDVDFGKSPVYEMAFIFSNTCAILYAYNYIFMIQTQIVWIRQITSKVDIVVWSIQDLLVDILPATNEQEDLLYSQLIDTRMRDIVRHHQSMYSLMEDYAIVYKKLLMFEQKCCGPVVCLTAYCIAEKFDEGEFQAILLLLCVATIVLHFIPSYMCTYLAFKVSSVCDACWSTPFWNAGPVIRPYMVLIMQRSLRPLPLQAPGFEDISIETFSKASNLKHWTISVRENG